MSVDVYIDRALITQQFSHQSKSRIHILQIRTGSIFPDIRICRLFQDGWFLFDSSLCSRLVYIWQNDLGSIVSFAVKGRIYIDQVYLSSHAWKSIGFISCKQGSHRQKIISINETIVSIISFVAVVKFFKKWLIIGIFGRYDNFIGLELQPSSLGDVLHKLFDFLFSIFDNIRKSFY